MQKFLIVLGLTCLAAVVSAAPAEEKKVVAILRSAADGPNPDGSYNWSYETENGIKAEEQGELKQSAGKSDEPIASVRGSYTFQADDGSPVEIRYTAGENGFVAEGDAIPQPPEIPPGILKALEWIAQHPEEDNL